MIHTRIDQLLDIKLMVIRRNRQLRNESRDPGTYQLECHATRNETTSDLYCLRLNRASGEMLLVALPKVGVVPAADK